MKFARFGPEGGQSLVFSAQDIAKFWTKVAKTDACWNWTGFCNVGGYGALNTSARRGPVAAHRISYTIHFGIIPAGKSVCHRCDNPRCVNPEHLFLGSHADNMRDMRAKDRGRVIIPDRRGTCGHFFTANNTMYAGEQRICALCTLSKEQERVRAEYYSALTDYRGFIREVVEPLLPTEEVARHHLSHRNLEVFARLLGVYGKEPEGATVLAYAFGVSRQRIEQIRDGALLKFGIEPALLNNDPRPRRFGFATALSTQTPKRRRRRAHFSALHFPTTRSA